MKSKIERIKEIADELKTMFPGQFIVLTLPVYDPIPEIMFGNPGTYAEATELMRELDCGERKKELEETYTRLTGQSHGVKVKALPNGLPPTCHKEKYIEKIPVEKTIQTGEFVEVERERIVCGE